MANVDSPALKMEKMGVDKSKNKIQWLAVKGNQKGRWVCWVHRWKRQTGCVCVCVYGGGVGWGGAVREPQGWSEKWEEVGYLLRNFKVQAVTYIIWPFTP